MMRVLCWKCAGHDLPRHARGCPHRPEGEASVPETVPPDPMQPESALVQPEVAALEQRLPPKSS